MNQMKFKNGTFTGAAAALNLNLGFIPDYFKWWMNESISAADIAKGQWDSGMTDGDAQVSKAVADSGATGNIDEQFETTNGITKLDTTKQVPEVWKASTVYAVGDVVRPTNNNGYFYKCSTAGTSHTAEPASWGTTEGGTTSEGGGTVVWTCYKQADIPVERTKVQGVTIGTGCMTNAKVYRYVAMRGN
jgi:hypothetical protein